MRFTHVLLLTLVLLTPVFAQDGDRIYKSDRYPVQALGPQGWKRTLSESRPAGAWVDLVAYEEEKTGAKLTLSAQSTNYRSSDEMISRLKTQFEQDATIAILLSETRSGKGPSSIYFEYTRKGARGPEHAIAAYWYLQGKRYRVYGVVREAGWRTVGARMDAFAKSVTFTSRVFAKNSQNYTDDASNFKMYFPEGWAVRLPARGPRVTFESRRLGTGVWVYVTDVRGELEDEVQKVYDRLQSGKVTGLEMKDPKNHPSLNLKVVNIHYRRGTGNKTTRHRETVILHRQRLYRFVLAASESSFDPGLEPYERMVSSIQFMK